MGRSNHGPYVAYWKGSVTKAIEAAASYLNAVFQEDGWVFYDSERLENYKADLPAMAAAGAAILSDETDWYSLWFASYCNHITPIPDSESSYGWV